jgi:DnaJ-class molecular chaperone
MKESHCVPCLGTGIDAKATLKLPADGTHGVVLCPKCGGTGKPVEGPKMGPRKDKKCPKNL